jgi:hypothetical protein
MAEKRVQKCKGAVLACAWGGEAPECQNHWYYTVQEIPLLINCKVLSVPKCHVLKLVCAGGG